jgi:hypothetical protein
MMASNAQDFTCPEAFFPSSLNLSSPFASSHDYHFDMYPLSGGQGYGPAHAKGLVVRMRGKDKPRPRRKGRWFKRNEIVFLDHRYPQYFCMKNCY